MAAKPIKIKFANGLTYSDFVCQVLWIVADLFTFEETPDADFLIFGPYGPPPPIEPGVVRIGYYCENILPNLDICDWAFGIPYEEEIRSKRYCRIEWHNISPRELVKHADDVRRQPIPPRFCNFVFSNSVGFRETFFRQLSRYKRVDAPGRSMNNRPSLDGEYDDGDLWSRKRRFLSLYKFTIAFENSSFPGYNTEKLTDPILAGSVPIYFGNSEVGRHYNPDSFVNAHDFLPHKHSILSRAAANLSHETYGAGIELPFRIRPRFRKAMRLASLQLRYGNDFSRLVDRIVEIDQDEELYRSIRSQPFFYENKSLPVDRVRSRWAEIFGGREVTNSGSSVLRRKRIL